MKALVTGGTGFLGKKLCLTLSEMGYNVTAMGRNEKIGLQLQESNIRFFKGDMSDITNVDAAIHDHSHVFHCGALSAPWGKYKDFYLSNVLATQNVVNASKKHNIKRLIHVSTPSIYVAEGNRLNISEDDPLPGSCINHYAKTKLIAEQIVDKAHGEGLATITIRPQAIFGPEDTNIFPRLIKACKRGYFPIIGSGTNIIDITYIDNVVDALIKCSEAPTSALGQKYNITNGEPRKLYEILLSLFEKLDMPINPKHIAFDKARVLAKWAEKIFKTALFGIEPPITEYGVLVFGLSRTLSIDKAMSHLNYKPRVTVDDGIERFVSWWRKNNGFR